MEQPEGAPWPVGRCSHAAACIGQDDPHLLISGGLDKAYRSLSDVWLYGLGTGRWREVSMSVVCTVTYYVYWWGCWVLGVGSVQYNVLFMLYQLTIYRVQKMFDVSLGTWRWREGLIVQCI